MSRLVVRIYRGGYMKPLLNKRLFWPFLYLCDSYQILRIQRILLKSLNFSLT